MRARELKSLRVGDEILVDDYDYEKDEDGILAAVVTQVYEDSVCCVSFDGSILFYSQADGDLKRVKRKTGRSFPEMAEILRKLRETKELVKDE